MITFVVTVQQEPDGRVRVHCETPPARATQEEINVGMEFKSKFKEWAQGVTDRDWGHQVKPSKN